MTNVFDFTLKVFFVTEMFKLLFWLSGHVRKCLNGKVWFASKFLTRYKLTKKKKKSQCTCQKISQDRNLACLQIKSLKIHILCFYCVYKWRTTKIYWNWRGYHLLSFHLELLQEIKRGFKLASWSHFYLFLNKLFFAL